MIADTFYIPKSTILILKSKIKVIHYCHLQTNYTSPKISY